MSPKALQELQRTLNHYAQAFDAKLHVDRMAAPDLLMEVFGITPAMKAAAPQYWGRELGMCWERLVVRVFQNHGSRVGQPLRDGAGTPCDLTVGEMAIDTKYRLGSGDAGTLKKLAANAGWLQSEGYEPVMLFLRRDSLNNARTRMRNAGWRVLEGDESFAFIMEHTGQDLESYLRTSAKHRFES